MSIERIPSARQPAWLELADIKQWARVNHDDDDLAFARLVDAVAREAEDYAQIALLDQTVRMLMPRWPRDHVRLPVVPILKRDSIRLTINAKPWTDILLDRGRRPLLMICGNPPPGVVVIEYRAGFGTQPEDIPADIRQALIDQVAVHYDARGAGPAKAVTLSPHFVRILARYRGVQA